MNNTDPRLPPSYFSLVGLLAGDTVVLDSVDTLEPQQRMEVAFTDSLELFGRLGMLPAVMQTDTRFAAEPIGLSPHPRPFSTNFPSGKVVEKGDVDADLFPMGKWFRLGTLLHCVTACGQAMEKGRG
ncbi:MAG: hypothetical protein RLZZ519_1794 [Bacteroidota bacterium]|mgnify:CR=1 FL=1|jgi:hypothetical protein